MTIVNSGAAPVVSGVPRPLSWPARIGLLMLAFVATAAHTASFAALPDAARFLPLAKAVAVASVVSWPVLGVLIWAACGRGRGVAGWRTVGAWFDTCLIAMNIGELVLGLSTAMNLVLWRGAGGATPVGPHVAVVVAADVVMAVVFVSRGVRFGQPVWRSLAWWVGGLNGTFVLVLWALARWG